MNYNTKITFRVAGSRRIKMAIYATLPGSLFCIEKAEALANGEPRIQLKEGHFYEYKLSKGFYLKACEIIQPSKVNKSAGRIQPNIYVGTFTLRVYEEKTNELVGITHLEIRSVKINYRNDYRRMLEEIAAYCTDIILQHCAHVEQNLHADFEATQSTLYQRFCFVKSIIDSEAFDEAISMIISRPATGWSTGATEKDVRAVRRITGQTLRQMVKSSNRISLPPEHALSGRLNSVPARLNFADKKETVDVPENRFVKYVLTTFLFFCGNIKQRAHVNGRLYKEALKLEEKLDEELSQDIFKSIALPEFLPLNNPVLQRQAGYREVLNAWLMFDLGAKLVWAGGRDVYNGGKKDVAVLYEYWLFFKLLETFGEVFAIEPEDYQQLFEKTKDGLGLQLKQGRHICLAGVYKNEVRNLNVEFCYNREFSAVKKYPEPGSWTRPLRPDYTLSIWPEGVSRREAEIAELIVLVHFDAKYKVDNLKHIFGTETAQQSGNFKSADLMKMHAYRDAIRRTAGAYILYPGGQEKKYRGFHEILPGLGAFPVSPSRTDDGTRKFKIFINDILQHFLNRASQREKMSFHTFDIYRNGDSEKLQKMLPESFRENRNFHPDKTTVLIGVYKNKAHYKWILKNGLYNTRTEDSFGSLKLGKKAVNAKYLLLRKSGKTTTGKLFKITGSGPRIFSKQKLKQLDYPTKPSQNFYLVFSISENVEPALKNYHWQVDKLRDFRPGKAAAIPFAVTFLELMKVEVEAGI